MRHFVIAAKLGFVENGVALQYGFSHAPYTLSTDGLEGGQWFQLLDPRIPRSVGLKTEHDKATPYARLGAISITDSAHDGVPSIVARLIAARVEGAVAQVWRGWSDQTLDAFETWFISRTGSVSSRGRRFTAEQLPNFPWLKKRIAGSVHADAPNKNLINRTVPVGVGEVFQDAGQIWDAVNLITYLSQSLHVVRGAADGGAPVADFVALDWGAQLMQPPYLQPTFDHGGPAADTETQTEVVRWDFDSWTGGLPNGIDVVEIAGVAEISEAAGGGAAQIDVTPNTLGDTGWVGLSGGSSRVVQQGGADWTDASGSLEGDVETADANFATVSLDDGDFSDRVRFSGFDVSAVPEDHFISGAEIELEHSGTDVQVWRLRVLDSIGRLIADFDRSAITVPGSNGIETIGGTGDLGTQLEARTGADVSAGGHVEVMARGNGASPSYSLGRIRVKLHYGDAVNTLRLYTPADVMTPGQRQRIRIDYEDFADPGLIQLGTVAGSGDPITELLDPFADSAIRIQGSGRVFRWLRADEAVWAMACKGSGKISLVTVDEIEDVKNRYGELLPWLTELTAGAAAAAQLDSTTLSAHATAIGDPVMGWKYAGGETLEDFYNLFTTDSGSGFWLPHADGNIYFGLWAPPSGTPDFTPEPEDMDAERVEYRSYEASFRTLRAVGARNWTPIPAGSAAGITFQFSATDRAALSEDYRVIRRADPDSLNPWPVS